MSTSRGDWQAGPVLLPACTAGTLDLYKSDRASSASLSAGVGDLQITSPCSSITWLSYSITMCWHVIFWNKDDIKFFFFASYSLRFIDADILVSFIFLWNFTFQSVTTMQYPSFLDSSEVKLFTTPRTWHPHIYHTPPKAPTAHGINDILGINSGLRDKIGVITQDGDGPQDLVVRVPASQPSSNSLGPGVNSAGKPHTETAAKTTGKLLVCY